MLRSSKLAVLALLAAVSLAHGQAIGPSPSGGGGGSPSGPAGGDLTGTYPNPSLIATGTAGTYGSATQVPQFTTDAKGRITGTSLVTVTPAIGSVTGLGTGVATALGINVGTAGSPVVNGGALGTPSSGTLSSATGLPISTGVSGLGTGVATALSNSAGGAGGFALVGTTPPTGSAGGDLTGTYPNPTLVGVITAGGPTGSATVAPIITYDAQGRLTTVSSATITPAIGSVTGLGTGVSTALGIAVGSAGAVVTNGGALGTPSSGVGTNLTSLNASNLASGTVAAARGGAGTITGALKGNGAGLVSQAACADLSNGAASCSTDTTNASNISSGTLASARGGAGIITGALKGNGSGVVSQAACADLSNAAASCSTDATNASNIGSGTLNSARLAWNGHTITAAPGAPTGTTSTTGVMAGVGSTCTITPTYSTRVFFMITGVIANNTSGSGSNALLKFGTGTAPTNGAAATGTTIGNASTFYPTPNANNIYVPFVTQGIVAGLTTGTAYWFDIDQYSTTSGTTTMLQITCTAFEI